MKKLDSKIVSRSLAGGFDANIEMSIYLDFVKKVPVFVVFNESGNWSGEGNVRRHGVHFTDLIQARRFMEDCIALALSADNSITTSDYGIINRWELEEFMKDRLEIEETGTRAGNFIEMVVNNKTYYLTEEQLFTEGDPDMTDKRCRTFEIQNNIYAETLVHRYALALQAGVLNLFDSVSVKAGDEVTISAYQRLQRGGQISYERSFATTSFVV